MCKQITMQKKISFLINLFLLIGLCISVNAQQTNVDTTSTKPIPTLSGTLAEQYNEVVVKSGSYKVYKNIKKVKIEEFWKNINDTLQYQKQLIKQSKTSPIVNDDTISALQAKIDSLQNIKAEEMIENTGSITNSVSIYLWIALMVLIIALVFALIRTRVAVKEANYRIELCDQLSEEIKDQRIKATEREKKLGRELQNERNRIEELLEKRKKN